MSLRVVFMGTPDFASASLEALLDAGIEVAAVFTQPDKPRDRGMKPAFSPVKELALERGIEVYQPASMRAPEAAEALRALAPPFSIHSHTTQPSFFRIHRAFSLQLPFYERAVHISLSLHEQSAQSAVLPVLEAPLIQQLPRPTKLLPHAVPLPPFERSAVANGAVRVARVVRPVHQLSVRKHPMNHFVVAQRQHAAPVVPTSLELPAVNHLVGLQTLSDAPEHAVLEKTAVHALPEAVLLAIPARNASLHLAHVVLGALLGVKRQGAETEKSLSLQFVGFNENRGDVGIQRLDLVEKRRVCEFPRDYNFVQVLEFQFS